MNAARAEQKKPDATSSCCPGPLIDEAALLDALKHRRIAGAAWMSSMKNLCRQTLPSGRWTTS